MKYICYSIILYTIIILILILIKPDFLYDHNNKQYKKFGRNKNSNETFFTLPVISIISALIIFLFVRLISKTKHEFDYVKIPVNYLQTPKLFQHNSLKI